MKCRREKLQSTPAVVDSEEAMKKAEELAAKKAEELAALKESVESLKSQLASAEQKNLHLTALNSELQKKVDAVETLNTPTV